MICMAALTVWRVKATASRAAVMPIRRAISNPSTPLTTGLRETWEWYLANHDEHQKKVNFFR